MSTKRSLKSVQCIQFSFCIHYIRFFYLTKTYDIRKLFRSRIAFIKMKEQEVDSLHSNGDIKIEATEVVEAKMKLEYILNGITDQDDDR